MRISIFGLFQCLACRKSHKARAARVPRSRVSRHPGIQPRQCTGQCSTRLQGFSQGYAQEIPRVLGLEGCCQDQHSSFPGLRFGRPTAATAPHAGPWRRQDILIAPDQVLSDGRETTDDWAEIVPFPIFSLGFFLVLLVLLVLVYCSISFPPSSVSRFLLSSMLPASRHLLLVISGARSPQQLGSAGVGGYQ